MTNNNPNSNSDDSLPDLSLDNVESTLNSHPEVSENDRKQIGPYRILQKIAEGGMGAVYMAQQSEPIKRRVALKLIKAGRDTEQIIARFEAERQALAMMDHANIARIFDAGTTDDGSPYFVMELVNGIPLTEYCDNNKLSIQQRLELFVPVCKAVQHAHTKGIIHRDLKPSNVLVGLYDGVPVPKVIDFGLAKATEHQLVLTDKTMFTEFGQIVGTLQYMSPEQAEMNQLDIDTRTDVYSLGVMLYELLTGSTPLDNQTMKDQALLKVLEFIRESEPPRPSTRLSDSGDAISGVSKQRRIEPSRLQKILKGELDWIVMKSLEKDRRRRYETANDFAQDISRFLTGEVVVARPASKSYQIQKFLRKNKGTVTSLATIMALLIFGIAGTTWYAVKAEAARKNIEKALKRSTETLNIVRNSFRITDPDSGFDAGLLATDVLKTAHQSLETSELDDEGKSEFLNTLTGCFSGIGDYRSGVETAIEEVDLKSNILGATHEDTLNAMNSLSFAYKKLDEINKAVSWDEKTYESYVATKGQEHPDTLNSLNSLAGSYRILGQHEKAIELLEVATHGLKGASGEEDEFSLTASINLGAAYVATGQEEKGVKLLESCNRKCTEVLGELAPPTLTAANNLAIGYSKTGKMKLAIETWERILPAMEQKLGVDHPETVVSKSNLAAAYKDMGRAFESIEMLENAYRRSKEALGEKHSSSLSIANSLAVAYQEGNRLDDALPLLKLTRLDLQERYGASNRRTLITTGNLANLYGKLGRYDEAIPMLEKTLQSLKKESGDSKPATLAMANMLASTCRAAKKYDRAIELGEESVAKMKTKWGEKNSFTLTGMNNLALIYREAGNLENAHKLFAETLTGLQENLGPTHPNTLTTMYNLADVYLDKKEFSKAEAMFRETMALRKTELGETHFNTIDSICSVAEALDNQGELEKAIELLQGELESLKGNAELDYRDRAMMLDALGKLFMESENHSDAIASCRESLQLRKDNAPEKWSTFAAQSTLGEALMRNGDLDEAEMTLKDAWAQLKNIETIDRKILTGTLERLVDCSNLQEDEDAAKKWQRELDESNDSSASSEAQLK
jgi:serine/threonine protein kinase